MDEPWSGPIGHHRAMPLTLPEVTDEQLVALESQVQAGIARRSLDGLAVLGFGEIGVAIGLPADAPAAVVKRLPAVRDRAHIDDWFVYLRRYEALLAPHVAIAPTEQRVVPTGDGGVAGYLVQPCYGRDLLVEHVLADAEPEVGHPIVEAVRDAALSALDVGRAAIDPQFSNFVWEDDTLISIDCGSPFLYTESGEADYDIGAFAVSMPAVLRPVVAKMASKVVAETGTPSGNLELSALSIVRIGQERWLDAVLATFNHRLDRPIDRDTVMARFDGLHGEMRNLKRLAQAQRFWQEKVRRRRYEFFITDSFTGEVL
ncbi:MAG: hypothetical protein AAGG08_02670 [Actinomycetota bacterium]